MIKKTSIDTKTQQRLLPVKEFKNPYSAHNINIGLIQVHKSSKIYFSIDQE